MAQRENRINLAIVAPHHRAQTESFIEAHERLIDANIFFYHGESVAIGSYQT